MSVGASHPRCFVVEGVLWVVPSDTGHDVEATRRSRVRDDGGGSSRRARLVDAWTLTGGATGAFFMGTVAGAVWHVEGLVDLAAFVVSGGLVGAVVAAGTRRLFVDAAAPDRVVARAPGEELPAVRVPWDVAASAPDDATGDELALWSSRTVRWRAARTARDARVPGPELSDGELGDETDREYQEAVADYEPVARLLGLPRPR
jgi:hypothetical protein